MGCSPGMTAGPSKLQPMQLCVPPRARAAPTACYIRHNHTSALCRMLTLHLHPTSLREGARECRLSLSSQAISSQNTPQLVPQRATFWKENVNCMWQIFQPAPGLLWVSHFCRQSLNCRDWGVIRLSAVPTQSHKAILSHSPGFRHFSGQISGSGCSAQKWEGVSGISKLRWVQSIWRLLSPTGWILLRLLPAPSLLCCPFCLLQTPPLLLRNTKLMLSSCHPPQQLLPVPSSSPERKFYTLSMPGVSSCIQKLGNCPKEEKGRYKGWPKVSHQRDSFIYSSSKTTLPRPHHLLSSVPSSLCSLLPLAFSCQASYQQGVVR